jgi:hypothetical protein
VRAGLRYDPPDFEVDADRYPLAVDVDNAVTAHARFRGPGL